MKRSDRLDPNHDNALNHPRSQSKEPVSWHEYKQKYLGAKADLNTVTQERDDLKGRVQENETAAIALVQVQQEFQAVQIEVQQWQERAQANYELFVQKQTAYEETLSLYTAEQARAASLLAQYEAADAERSRYLTLYNESQDALKFERRSKAGIKGWETRRKAENARLKQEIGEMTILLKESLDRKEEAIDNLYVLANRMDRIQRLVDSVDDESASTPIGMVQKLKRIWAAVKEILAE